MLDLDGGVSARSDLKFFKGEKGGGFLRIFPLSFHVSACKLSQFTVSYKSGTLKY